MLTPAIASPPLFLLQNPSCADDDYAAAPHYVFPSRNDWSTSHGWGLSRDKPFRTIQHAADERGECQTIYVMEGTHRNKYYGQSRKHNKNIVNLNGVSDVKIFADPDGSAAPVLEFDGHGAIAGGTASNPVSGIEIVGLDVSVPNAAIMYAEAVTDRRIKRISYSGRGIAIRVGYHIYIHKLTVTGGSEYNDFQQSETLKITVKL